MSKGKVCLLLSALIYGILPALATIAYSGGANGITLTFLRCTVALPLLYVIIKADKRSMRLTKKQVKDVAILGIFGGALPILSLYLSYNYIPTGLATTLHFVYPLVIILSTAVLYHEKLTRITLSAVVLVTIGIFMFADINATANKFGIILAILSGIFYSFFVIFIDRSGLDRLDYVVLTFYLMFIMSISTLIFGIATSGISFNITPLGWSFAVIISLAVTLGAMPLFQAGVRYEGAATAGILSTIEPITSIVIGVMFLGEFVGPGQIIGGALIIMGVLMSQRKHGENTAT